MLNNETHERVCGKKVPENTMVPINETSNSFFVCDMNSWSFQIHGYYRATGASLTKAQAEFATNVFSNEGVRNAAASAAAAGVRQGFSVKTRKQHAKKYSNF